MKLGVVSLGCDKATVDSERLVEVMATESRVVPYLDIPIQHAADRLLERMRRPERQHTIREKVAWLRRVMPDVAIRTTHVGCVPWQADDVDGVTYVSRGGWVRSGEFVRVRIHDNIDYDFRAAAVG